ncbi:MAG TPA: glycosyltransferase family 2 protein [Gammaproteobacteria bacterium]|nr:glycosyltransferase family 2 protein [Gammaproteobacteria bacterium]
MNGISIIIPLYNKEKTIANCLDKIFSQTVTSFEVIVVDDGSTDKSIENLQEYLDRITLICQGNQGPASARNNGAKISRYDHLAFVDADDEITREFVESHLYVRQIESEIELSINSFKVFVDRKLKRTELLSSRYSGQVNEYGYFVLNEFNHFFCTNIHSSGFCVDKKLFFKVSGFDEELKCWEISDALMRLSLEAKRVAIIDKFLSLVFEDDNSLFKLENTNLEYKRKFCNNILKAMQSIPDGSKKRYFKELEYLCWDYWRAFRFKELVLFYMEIMGHPDAKSYFSLPVKIKIVVRFLMIFYSR